MTDTSLSARFAEGDFRVGRVLNRTSSVLSRNFLPFFIVTAIANLPGALIVKSFDRPRRDHRDPKPCFRAWA